MKNQVQTGPIMEEPLLWKLGRKNRSAFSCPEREVPSLEPDSSLAWDGPDLPDLSEVEVVRHFTRLSTWNFGVDTGMYPLGSCTMKYNPKTNERQASLPGFSWAHPLVPEDLNQGALALIKRLEEALVEITGMDAASLQPAAGAHGELAGILMIHAFHAKEKRQRSKILVPDTAHGTNPASAALCGYQPVKVVSGEKGILSSGEIDRLMDEDTAGIMVTNPNTLGLFEEEIVRIAEIIHSRGGLVYCDGANMNALLGIVDMKALGIDILHLNLHKTFSAPHGGGGPGSGPVCVTKRLEPFLPVPRVAETERGYLLTEDHPDSIGRMLTFYGHFGVMIKALSYILSMGAEGLRLASQMAVLNANYIKERLKERFHLPYDRSCMHECVFTDRFQEKYSVATINIAKRLMDYGFHPPTVYFPLVVKGAIMIEPTETESKQEIDRFIEAMLEIANEAETDPGLLHEAPHKTRVGRLDEVTAARRPRLAE